jgi:hypothetical protein
VCAHRSVPVHRAGLETRRRVALVRCETLRTHHPGVLLEGFNYLVQDVRGGRVLIVDLVVYSTAGLGGGVKASGDEADDLGGVDLVR